MTKFPRWAHPPRPMASELTGWRRQSYPWRPAPMAVKAAMNSGPATAPHPSSAEDPHHSRSSTVRMLAQSPQLPQWPRRSSARMVIGRCQRVKLSPGATLLPNFARARKLKSGAGLRTPLSWSATVESSPDLPWRGHG